MKCEIIYTEHYALIVSDEIIKENDFCYDLVASPGYKDYKSISKCLRTAEDSYWNTHSKKIIGHRPLKDAHILKGVPLLPEFGQEEDFEDWIKETSKDLQDRLIKDTARMCLKAGYNKAKETYKYTEEDLRKAIEMAITSKYEYKLEFYNQNEIIQSLQQPKRPKYFECKMDSVCRLMSSDRVEKEGWIKEKNTKTTYSKPKTTNNSQGQTELSGKYIFE